MSSVEGQHTNATVTADSGGASAAVGPGHKRERDDANTAQPPATEAHAAAGPRQQNPQKPQYPPKRNQQNQQKQQQQRGGGSNGNSGGRSIIYSRDKKLPPETIVAFLAAKFKYFSEEEWRGVVARGGTYVGVAAKGKTTAAPPTPSNAAGAQSGGTTSEAAAGGMLADTTTAGDDGSNKPSDGGDAAEKCSAEDEEQPPRLVLVENVAVPRVYVNGALVVDPNRLLAQQDRVAFVAPPVLEPTVDEAFTLLYEDAVMVAVAKSGNIPVSEGGRYRHNTLIRVVRESLERRRRKVEMEEEKAGDTAAAASGHRNSGGGGVAAASPPPQPLPVVPPPLPPITLFTVHRLDKETSGIVVFAKSREAAAVLGGLFAEKGAGGDGTKRAGKGTPTTEVAESAAQDDEDEGDDANIVAADQQMAAGASSQHSSATSLTPFATMLTLADSPSPIPTASSSLSSPKIEKYYLAMVSAPLSSVAFSSLSCGGPTSSLTTPSVATARMCRDISSNALPFYIRYRIGFEGEADEIVTEGRRENDERGGSDAASAPTTGTTPPAATASAAARSLAEKMKMKCFSTEPYECYAVNAAPTTVTAGAVAVEGGGVRSGLAVAPSPSSASPASATAAATATTAMRLLGKASLTQVVALDVKGSGVYVVGGEDSRGEGRRDDGFSCLYTCHGGSGTAPPSPTSPTSSLSSPALSFALATIRLFTGRTHQIRVHLAGIGAPIVGDKLYYSGGGDTDEGNTADNSDDQPNGHPTPPLDRTVPDVVYLSRTRGEVPCVVGTLRFAAAAEGGEADGTAKGCASDGTDAYDYAPRQSVALEVAAPTAAAPPSSSSPLLLVADRHCLHAARLVIPLTPSLEALYAAAAAVAAEGPGATPSTAVAMGGRSIYSGSGSGTGGSRRTLVIDATCLAEEGFRRAFRVLSSESAEH